MRGFRSGQWDEVAPESNRQHARRFYLAHGGFLHSGKSRSRPSIIVRPRTDHARQQRLTEFAQVRTKRADDGNDTLQRGGDLHQTNLVVELPCRKNGMAAGAHGHREARVMLSPERVVRLEESLRKHVATLQEPPIRSAGKRLAYPASVGGDACGVLRRVDLVTPDC